MKDAFPLVSIITPVYNGEEFIEELIVSVKGQSYPNVEHLIIDDGSDDVNAIATILSRYPHVKWRRRKKNEGQYFTMNEGLLSAKGEVVCFISADGLTGYIDADGNILTKPTLFPRAPISLVGYFAHIPHCSLYIKRSSLERYQLFFNPSLTISTDTPSFSVIVNTIGLFIALWS